MLIFDAGNASRTVWIVFDFLDRQGQTSREAVIEQTVVAANTTTAVTDSDATGVVAASVLLFAL